MAGIETMGIQEHLPQIMHVSLTMPNERADCM
jgi:hypothetical protein